MINDNQTNQILQDNQLATLSFPPGINLQQFIVNMAANESIGIVFVIYDQSALFPINENSIIANNNEDDDVITTVGSPVVSLTIAGLLAGTILPEPIEINLRIVNTTGVSICMQLPIVCIIIMVSNNYLYPEPFIACLFVCLFVCLLLVCLFVCLFVCCFYRTSLTLYVCFSTSL